MEEVELSRTGLLYAFLNHKPFLKQVVMCMRSLLQNMRYNHLFGIYIVFFKCYDIHPFNKYLLNTYYIPGTEDIMGKKTGKKFVSSPELTF